MARGINRLPASFKRLGPGMHCDGGNLYLQVTLGAADNRRASWIFRYALKGRKPRDMGLGSADDVTLSEARETAREYRNHIRQGIDPIGRRDAAIAQNLAASAAVMSFDEAATIYIRNHRAAWKSPVHAAQWGSTLKMYASPVIGRMSVAEIETAHVLKVIEPIWHEKTETAGRVRGRIEAVLGWATVSGHRKGENPARWRDHLDNLLPARSKVRAVRHQTALPYGIMPAFMSDLRQRSGMGALALEFAILTCVRTADVRNAKHADIDRAAAMWIIPLFSKTAAEHRVPLSTAALATFDRARAMATEIGGAVGRSEFAFPNDVTGAHLSENAMLAVLDRMGRKGEMTTHGCRSTFRTWAQEQTNFPWELAEMSLGHKVGNKVERAYARGDAFKKRIAIMQAWANFCDRPVVASGAPTGNILQIAGRR
ncbi:MAG: tyrosine-type recombinase/integrase [Methylocella sp.]